MASKISIQSENPIERFYFDKMGSWTPAPSWVQFFVDLGSALASVEIDRENLVLAVTTPTRAFAANLIALGLISARSGIKQQVSADQHFERLCNLKPGTVVQCLEKEKKYRAEFIGIESFMGEQGAKVKLQKSKNTGTRFISEKILPEGHALQWLTGNRKSDVTKDEHHSTAKFHQAFCRCYLTTGICSSAETGLPDHRKTKHT